jgi:hypothetical protein
MQADLAAESGIGPKRRKTMSFRMSAIGGSSGLVVLNLSFVNHDLKAT